ncbi:nicotinate phosphoribosyltransferase [Desulfitibacter alkalitolerans]|uniref:nicotinate phosphoribosyltransferase n=1 Tax=Desulfitibacter alkalitolerans TaxID=264641 RepID=UPI00054EBC58
MALERNEVNSLEQVKKLKIEKDRPFFSAQHEEIANGAVSDIYFIRTNEILKKQGLLETTVTAEVFPRRDGVLAGIEEVKNLLSGKNIKVWALKEGHAFKAKDVVMRIEGAYGEFGIHETALLGILAHSSGWATAAHEIKQIVKEKPFFSFGARHVHPSVAPVMDRAALIGGASGASCILGAKLFGVEPVGTAPHTLFLIVGDTVKAAQAYDKHMPEDALRLMLVDTFKDEAEEALRVAGALKEKLYGIRLDTPSERGGVRPELIREVRARLDQAGFQHVKIFVSGGLTPERIEKHIEAGADAFGVGSYISGRPPIDMTMDIKEINGKPAAKRGRIPGRTAVEGIERIL